MAPYRIAVTTSDGTHIDLHFGHADRFLILEADDTGTWHEVEYRPVPTDPANGEGAEMKNGPHGHDDSRFERIADALADTDYLLTQRIGPRPHRILMQRGISALESPEDLSEAIAALIRWRTR